MSPQLVAIETMQKGKLFENFSKLFTVPPHLYKGIQRTFEQPKCLQFTNCLRVSLYYIRRFRVGLHNHKSTQFTIYLRLVLLLYLPIYRTVERIKLQIISNYICHFAMGSLRTNCFFLYQYKGNSKRFLVGWFAKVSSLNSHENGVLAGCFFKNSKYVYKHPSHLIALIRSKT